MKKCPYCTADIPDEAKKCKHCGEWVEPRDAPASDLRLSVGPPTRGPTKPCPYCSALIPKGAWTCMYCKRSVIGGRPMAVGLVMLGVLIAVIFIFGFWLPQWNKARREHEDMRRNFPAQGFGP